MGGGANQIVLYILFWVLHSTWPFPAASVGALTPQDWLQHPHPGEVGASIPLPTLPMFLCLIRCWGY